jgi:hypothetical protein
VLLFCIMSKDKPKAKNPHAMAMVRARLKKLTPARRAEIAKNAAAVRWKSKEPTASKPRDEPLPPAMSKKLIKKAATDPKFKNKTMGAKKI